MSKRGRPPTRPETIVLRHYASLLQAEAKTKSLLPDRLVTLEADDEWIAAVAAKNEAMQQLIAATMNMCEHWLEKSASRGARIRQKKQG